MEAIGLLESNSIAKGIEAADAILKAADTELLVAKPTCPGKYTVLFTGDVAAVKASLDAGETVLQSTKVDSEVIPRIHPQVVETLKDPRKVKKPAALGVMEFRSIIAAVYAADAAVKAAENRALCARSNRPPSNTSGMRTIIRFRKMSPPPAR